MKYNIKYNGGSGGLWSRSWFLMVLVVWVKTSSSELILSLRSDQLVSASVTLLNQWKSEWSFEWTGLPAVTWWRRRRRRRWWRSVCKRWNPPSCDSREKWKNGDGGSLKFSATTQTQRHRGQGDTDRLPVCPAADRPVWRNNSLSVSRPEDRGTWTRLEEVRRLRFSVLTCLRSSNRSV